MGIVAIKIKLMPTDLDADLNEIKITAETKIVEHGGKVNSIEEENIAFGLKAIIITLAWPEEKDTSILENLMAEISEVNSAQIIDYRRAFG